MTMTTEPSDRPNELTSHEWKVLKMLNGDLNLPWGAMVNACLEHLEASDYCTRGPGYKITEKGRQALRDKREATSE